MLRSTTLLRAGLQQFQRTLEWLYVKDAARAVQLVLNAEKLHSRVFNVGMGKIYTPEEIVSEVLKIMPRAPITVEQLPAGDTGYSTNPAA